MDKKFVIVLIPLILVSGCIQSDTGQPSPVEPLVNKSSDWELSEHNPILSSDPLKQPNGLPDSVKNKAYVFSWNDPSVMKESGNYIMWASLGISGGGKDVAIYRLESENGINWVLTNKGNPVLEPGNDGEFDFFGVETPAVIKAGDLYHMYYTSYHDPDPDKGGTLYTMGHATSDNGVDWDKKGELASIKENLGNPEGNRWGWLSRAEPAPLYYNRTFYLYFTDIRCRSDDCRTEPTAIRGISLATSEDGHDFKQKGIQPVLLQTESYKPEDGWEGYSTPWVYHNGETFELYVDVFRVVGDRHVQTALARYRSGDGVNFEEVESDVIVANQESWSSQSVRSPTVVEEGDKIMLWFAGDGFIPGVHTGEDVRSGKVEIGIGLAFLNISESRGIRGS